MEVYKPNNKSENFNIKESFKELWKNISTKRKRQFINVICVMIISGFFEIITVSSIFPYISALADPEKFSSLKVIRFFSEIFNINQNYQIIFITTLLISILFLLSSCIRLLNLFMNLKISADIGSDLSKKIIQNTLYKSYSYHTEVNSSVLLSSSTTQLDLTVATIKSFMQLITGAVLSISLIGVTLFYESQLALFCAGSFIFIYLFLGKVLKNRLSKNSNIIASSAKKQVLALQEALGGIRDIILDNSQELFIKNYSEADKLMRYKLAINQFFAGCPRFTLEALSLTIITLAAYLIFLNNPNPINLFSSLAVLALVAQKLLPALQLCYSSWSEIKSYSNSFNQIINLSKDQVSKIKKQNVYSKLNFKKSIELKEVSFFFSENNKLILDNINLSINKGEKIGLIGESGAGKSTLVDIIMSLLFPTNGNLLIDGKPVKKDDINYLGSWRSSIAHVPQMIYLTDSDFYRNIAFGVKPKDINYEKVKEVSKKALIYDFINDLPNGFNTFVGERGIKLSGGQRQRIGLARALYKDASLLILDEATSALDSENEEQILSSINGLSQEITIVIIAHRYSTLKNCDKIFKIDGGKLEKMKSI